MGKKKNKGGKQRSEGKMKQNEENMKNEGHNTKKNENKKHDVDNKHDVNNKHDVDNKQNENKKKRANSAEHDTQRNKRARVSAEPLHFYQSRNETAGPVEATSERSATPSFVPFSWNRVKQYPGEDLDRYCERVMDLFSANGGYDRAQSGQNLLPSQQAELKSTIEAFVDGMTDEDVRNHLCSCAESIPDSELSLRRICITAVRYRRARKTTEVNESGQIVLGPSSASSMPTPSVPTAVPTASGRNQMQSALEQLIASSLPLTQHFQTLALFHKYRTIALFGKNNECSIRVPNYGHFQQVSRFTTPLYLTLDY